MNAVDYAWGIGVICWLGCMVQFGVVMVSSFKRSRKG